MENIKDFAIATTFILVTSVALLFFVLSYPASNGQISILGSSSQFNQTATQLNALLGNYQTQQNLDINISTADTPTINAQSIQLVSTVATSRNLFSRLTKSVNLIFELLGNALGMSGTTFALIVGSITALFGLVGLYFLLKFIRWGI